MPDFSTRGKKREVFCPLSIWGSLGLENSSEFRKPSLHPILRGRWSCQGVKSRGPEKVSFLENSSYGEFFCLYLCLDLCYSLHLCILCIRVCLCAGSVGERSGAGTKAGFLVRPVNHRRTALANWFLCAHQAPQPPSPSLFLRQSSPQSESVFDDGISLPFVSGVSVQDWCHNLFWCFSLPSKKGTFFRRSLPLSDKNTLA